MQTTNPRLHRTALLSLALALALVGGGGVHAAEAKKLNVLFIGNSYTARHRLATVVKAMAEAGNPGLTFDITQVIYGGRRLVDHWRLGTQNYVRISELTVDEEKATIESLKKAIADDPKDKYAKGALKRHQGLLKGLEKQRKTWDIVVLQSYRDDVQGADSLYVEYAPRFAELIKAQGARIVLYETTPHTQNAKPLTAAPDKRKAMSKARVIAALANRIDATVVPMGLVAFRCQTERPDFTLRFINDAHLNHTMAYLTACTFYGAIFDRTPQGLAVDSITDIRFLDKDNKDKDRDGRPIKRTFAGKDLADLQRIAWKALTEFNSIRAKLPAK
ncbi:MAG: hypothetical protein HN742_14520 [Lentisphaerae bacterium]|jgi:hypothetical protein|nr:hypothetical protein [Lentisphaerota bacterium]MBT4821401.1 hypothetical protein [Lentisphaerota bacterium]MBT5606833.1 hypothetical protein [Lentisphaerota bacterium]MBT7055309.1 hypothetical protein [Lentisphaerota bacterium]MBT7843090.1 hypothetical protein [Lentisphaerota bacterium]